MAVPDFQYNMPQYPQQYVEYPVEYVEAEEGSTMTSFGARKFGLGMMPRCVAPVYRSQCSGRALLFFGTTNSREDEISESGVCITDSGPFCSAWRRAPALRCWRPTR